MSGRYTQDEIFALLDEFQKQGREVEVVMVGREVLSVKVFATSPYLEMRVAKARRGDGE